MQTIETGRLPIMLWSDEELEGEVRTQAMNLAHHPYTRDRIAIMPDCLTEDTEVLTDRGFKTIISLTLPKNIDDKVANFDPDTGNVQFSRPKCVIGRPLREGEIVYSFHIPNMDKSICMTENHRTSIRKDLGKVASNVSAITEIKDYIWGGNGISKEEYNIPDEFICLIAWVVGDGNIKKSNRKSDGTYSSKIIRFGITKDRKISRIVDILDALEYKYHIREDKKQTSIELNVESSKKIIEVVGEDKEYPIDFLTKLSRRQALTFINEAIRVDGDYIAYLKYGSYRFNTSRQSDADFISALIAINCGIAIDRTRMSDAFGTKYKMHYIDMIANESIEESGNGYNRGKVIRKKIDYKGNVVCITCNTGFFIARQNGLTFITGNCHVGYGMPIGGVCATKGVIIPEAVGVDISCGVHAARTSLQNISYNDLLRIVDEIKSKIPVGFNHRSESLWSEMPSIDVDKKNMPVVNAEYDSACHQLGTLGGGK